MKVKREKIERKVSIAQMLAKLQGIKFEPKELIDNWILLTYDIPAGSEGNKARYQFIKKVPQIGAVMHTRSVYLIPWSNEAEIAALEVTKAGQAFLWTSQVKDAFKQKELTEFYDVEIHDRLKKISNRIGRIKKHQENNEMKAANRMVKKTAELLNDIATAASHRKSLVIMEKTITLYGELMKLSNGKSS